MSFEGFYIYRCVHDHMWEEEDLHCSPQRYCPKCGDHVKAYTIADTTNTSFPIFNAETFYEAQLIIDWVNNYTTKKEQEEYDSIHNHSNGIL